MVSGFADKATESTTGKSSYQLESISRALAAIFFVFRHNHAIWVANKPNPVSILFVGTRPQSTVYLGSIGRIHLPARLLL